MFFEFSQNNSGGHFDVNDKVCHRLFIEADTHEDALSIAEDLGCYWNGVENGIDCPCCGDRWYPECNIVDIEYYCEKGYLVNIYDGIYPNTVAEWNQRYGKYEIISEPAFKNSHYSSSRYYGGSIKLKNIEEYAQFMSDEYGWTVPDARIYYKNGTVKEIFSEKTY